MTSGSKDNIEPAGAIGAPIDPRAGDSGAAADYRALFQKMDRACAVCVLARNASGRAVSYTWREVNEAFENLIGFPSAEVVGRPAGEVVEGLDGAFWVTGLANAVEGGGPVRFEREVEALGKWLAVSVIPISGDSFHVIYEDITRRKRTEASLRQTEDQQAFLLRLSDMLRPLADPAEIRAKAADLLASFLGARHVGYVEITGEREAELTGGHPSGGVPEGGYDGLVSVLVDECRGRGSVTVDDLAKDGSLSGEMKATLEGLGVAALAAKPLFKGNSLLAVLFAVFDEPHGFAEEETGLIEESVERIWGAVERARGEQALRMSEEKYRGLFESIDEGFCLIEVLFDDVGKAYDFRFLEVNPAFEVHTSLQSAGGRTIRELVPDTEDHWIEAYERIVLTGQPERMEHTSKPQGRHFDVYAFRVGQPLQHQVAVLLSDVTERKRRESNLSFLAGLQSELSRRWETAAILESVGRRLRSYLRASAHYLVVCDGKGDRAEARATGGQMSLPVFPAELSLCGHLGEETIASLEGGHMVVVRDTAADSRCAGSVVSRKRDVGAFVAVPQLRNGKLISVFLIHDNRYRDWRHDEVRLIRELGEHIFLRLERAKAKEAINADFRDTQLLRDLGARLVSETEIQTFYDEVNAAAIKLAGADGGMVQAFDEDRQELVLISSHGFPEESWERFLRVDATSSTSCGKAIVGGDRTFVDFDDLALADPKGDLRWVVEAGFRSAQSTPLVGRSGRLIGMLSTHWRKRHRPKERELRYLDLLARQVADLIEQREAERKVAENEERLSAIFAGAQVGLAEATLDGRFLSVNDALCRMMARSREDFLSKDVVQVTHPSDVGVTLEKLALLKETGMPVSLDKRYVRPDGGLVWANSSISLLKVNPRREPTLLAVVMDLTERRKAEAARREARRHLELVMESVTEYAIITMDKQGLVTGWNIGAVRMFGYAPDEIIGGPVHMLFTPEDNAARIPEKEMLVARETGRAVDERWHMKMDGERFWVSGVMSPLRNAGALSGYVKVARDLTEQRKAEAALQDSRARFRTLSNAVPQLVWTNDTDGRAGYFNRRWFDYTGLTYEASEGAGWQAVVHPDDAEASIGLWHEALESVGTFEAEFRLRGKDGSYRWFIGRCVPLKGDDGEVIGWFGSGTDIEGLKNAQSALRESEERLRIAIQSAELATWDWNVVAGQVIWNDFHFRVLGLEPEAGPLGLDHFQRFVHPEDRERVTRRLTEAVEKGGDYKAEFRIVRTDGEIRWMDGYGRAVEREGGRATRMAGVMYDSTERRHAAERLQRAKDDLEYRVEQRTRDLGEALGQLQAEVAERQKIEEARHELLRRLVDTQEEERERISRELHDNLGQHMVAMMMQMENLRSQIAQDSGVTESAAEGFRSLRAVADDLIKAVHRQAWELRPAELNHLGLDVALRHYVNDWSGRTGIPVDFQSSGDPERDASDVDIAFYRIVQEALTNVARHAKASCASIRLDLDLPSVTITDDGKGFETDKATNRLGLLGMQERMLLAGGVLEIQSAPGEGTTVTARLSG